MVVPNGATSTVSGLVVSTNPKGFRIAGYDDWLNFSKYADGIEPPQKGETVTATLDRAGFVRAVAPSDGSEASLRPSGAQNATSAQNKDRTITRLAVLKAAAEFGAARPLLKSGDVLRIAEVFERWVTRDDATSDDDLDEAF